MQGMSRRRAIAVSAGATLAATTGVGRARAAVPAGAIRIEEVRTAFQEHRYRTPYKFGGVPVDRATILDVEIDTVGADGRRVTGFASMPLGNVWSFPTRSLPDDVTLGAMKGLASRIEGLVAGCTEVAHPLELVRILEPEFV